METGTDDEGYLLDLLNSTPIVDGVAHDELGTASAGRTWLRDHGLPGSAREWQAVRSARATLQAVVRGNAPARTVAPLVDRVSYVPAASDDGLQWHLAVPAGGMGAARAVLAWDSLRCARPGRLRACENPECALFLIDHSKPNRARWCSMAACGNRMKARRYYERARNDAGR
jgi:predicted RNA-binding Zn ribbon-like protein